MYFVAEKYSGMQVEDIINDGCVALIRKISLLKTLDCVKLRTYVINTIRNIAINTSKKYRREANLFVHLEPDDTEFLSDAPEIDENLIRLASIDELISALKKLPQKYFDILDMRYFQDLDDRGMSDILNITPDSVRVYLSRARALLRKEILKQGCESNGAQYK